MLPITWNPDLEKWEVKNEAGTILWRANTYGDAAKFAEDYTRQQAIKNAITVGTSRG